VALILVLGALTLLTVMLTEVQDEAAGELASALAERDAVKAEYAARSAINLGRLVLASEPTISGSLGIFLMALGGGGGDGQKQLPVWEHADVLLGAFNDEAGVQSFAALAGANAEQGKNLGLPGASFDITIIDEDSKFNVNTPARGSPSYSKAVADQFMAMTAGPQYDDLFELKDDEGNNQQRATVCSALVDWADPNQELFVCGEEESGASAGSEDNFYERLKRPYERKNAAFDSLEELRLVQGVGDDFWYTFVDPDPDDPKKRNVTVWGQEKINIATANPQIILTLICRNAVAGQPLCESPEEQAKFLMMLNMVKGMGMPLLLSPEGFVKAVTGTSKSPMAKMLMEGAGIQPVQQKSNAVLRDSLTTKSEVFSIYATGHVKSGTRATQVRVHAVVDMRGAPAPGQARRLDDLVGGPGSSTTPENTPESGGTEGLSPEGIAAALRKSAGGEIIYYRVD
jgi:general secretion pathway protein K